MSLPLASFWQSSRICRRQKAQQPLDFSGRIDALLHMLGDCVLKLIDIRHWRRHQRHLHPRRVDRKAAAFISRAGADQPSPGTHESRARALGNSNIVAIDVVCPFRHLTHPMRSS